MENVDEVVREYKDKKRDKPVDYGLLLMGKPRLFIEAKALFEDLGDRRWANQVMGYAVVAGVEWVVLTNGDEYRIYNSHAAVTADEKLFRKFRISDDDGVAERTLPLLGRDRMAENKIQVLWKAEFVDRQVKATLDEMFEPGDDTTLVKLVRRRIAGLSPAEIKASLRRAQVEITFPAAGEEDGLRAGGGRGGGDVGGGGRKQGMGLAGGPGRRSRLTDGTAGTGRSPASDHSTNPKNPSATKKPRLTLAKGPGKRRASVGVSMADLIRAGLVKPPLEIAKTYRGVEVRAMIEADGSVLFDGERADTISRAADLARIKVLKEQGDAGKTKVNTNGWTWWTFVGLEGKGEQDKPRTLDEVRREYLEDLEGGGADGDGGEARRRG